MPAPEPIVISWEEWQASRAKKREILKAYGLDALSRRQHGYGSAERRLQKTFGAKRVPEMTAKACSCLKCGRGSEAK